MIPVQILQCRVIPEIKVIPEYRETLAQTQQLRVIPEIRETQAYKVIPDQAIREILAIRATLA